MHIIMYAVYALYAGLLLDDHRHNKKRVTIVIIAALPVNLCDALLAKAKMKM